MPLINIVNVLNPVMVEFMGAMHQCFSPPVHAKRDSRYAIITSYT